MMPQTPTDERNSAGLRPPQFGTRALLGWVAVIAALLTFAIKMGPVVTVAVLIAFLAVLAHVAGNAIGSQLRRSASQSREDWKPDATAPQPMQRDLQRPDSQDFAPATALSHRRALGRSVLVGIGVGALVGGALGGGLLAALNWQRATPANIALGALSFGVLGSLFGFGASSFFQVLWGALSQAHRHGKGP